jgi:kumamolisin
MRRLMKAVVVAVTGLLANAATLGAVVRAQTVAVAVVPSSGLAKPQDAGVVAQTHVKFYPPRDIAGVSGAKLQPAPTPLTGPPFTGKGYETPASLACLYGLTQATAGCNPNTATSVPNTLGSKAIAIVDAYDYPTALADLTKFSAQFGLPAPSLSVKYATVAGACNGSKPPNSPEWEVEEALDVEMAHAMAPKALIYLVEAQSNSYSDLMGAVACANSLLTAIGGGEVSMSWGSAEFAGETTYDPYFRGQNIVYFAASGDAPGAQWPSTSPNVVSVGGTSISRTLPDFNFQHHYSWSDSGGGPSAYYALPAYQANVPGISGVNRVTPDVSAVANPNTGVWVYDSNPLYGAGWFVVGGTSVATPVIAGLTNAAGAFRANTAAELTAIYDAKKQRADLYFAIPKSGYCGPYASYTVSADWNYCAGVGTPKGRFHHHRLVEAER